MSYNHDHHQFVRLAGVGAVRGWYRCGVRPSPPPVHRLVAAGLSRMQQVEVVACDTELSSQAAATQAVKVFCGQAGAWREARGGAAARGAEQSDHSERGESEVMGAADTASSAARAAVRTPSSGPGVRR